MLEVRVESETKIRQRFGMKLFGCVSVSGFGKVATVVVDGVTVATAMFDGSGYIYNVFTVASHRRRGYAAMALEKVLEVVNTEDAYLWCQEEIQALYERQGFVVEMKRENVCFMRWTNPRFKSYPALHAQGASGYC